MYIALKFNNLQKFAFKNSALGTEFKKQSYANFQLFCIFQIKII